MAGPCLPSSGGACPPRSLSGGPLGLHQDPGYGWPSGAASAPAEALGPRHWTWGATRHDRALNAACTLLAAGQAFLQGAGADASTASAGLRVTPR